MVMRMYDLINKKKYGKELSTKEIQIMIQEYVKEEIPDYQMAAFLMAVYFNGMSDKELSDFTLAMAHSGEMIDLSPIQGTKVDKHSTGGVGDKTTLIIGPMVAACGEKVAKMSGRGLGFTGGTIDKLESIPGFQTSIPDKKFFENVNKIGLSVMGQSKEIALADKKIYALRDVTATVDSIPLIAASVMSKKIASGSDCILLDVTVGSGAFMKNETDAITLAEKMVAIGEQAGKETVAVLTNMDEPLGNKVGNIMEVEEAVEVLMGMGPKDLIEVSIELAGNMLYLAKKKKETITLEQCREMAAKTLQDGSALEKFIQMIEAQGGDSKCIRENRFPKAEYNFDVITPCSGYITHINAEQCGIASVMLGAGRETKESVIDSLAGIHIHKKTGDYVEPGDCIATVYAESYDNMIAASETLLDAYRIEQIEKARKKEQMILRRITK